MKWTLTGARKNYLGTAVLGLITLGTSFMLGDGPSTVLTVEDEDGNERDVVSIIKGSEYEEGDDIFVDDEDDFDAKFYTLTS